MEDHVVQNHILLPGHIITGYPPSRINTVLGSGVAVCMWDSLSGLGGMCHFVYPKVAKHERRALFGDVAVPHLMQLLLHKGVKRANLVVQLLGGACAPQEGRRNMGYKNIHVAKTLLHKWNLLIHSEDTGGYLGRKVVLDLQTGHVAVVKVHRLRDSDWFTKDGE
jgi:chemotaxis protein CheD